MGYVEGLADATGGVTDTKRAVIEALNAGEVAVIGSAVMYTIVPDPPTASAPEVEQ
jgi:hypothetical protein